MLNKLSRFTAVVVSMLCLLPLHAVDITILTDDPSSARFVYGCQVFTHSGTYDNVLYEGETCTLNLRICQPSGSSMSQTIVLGEKFLFGCNVLQPSEVGTTVHYDTLLNSTGCDSIVTLTLRVVPVPCDTVWSDYKDSIFEGDKYLFGCQKLATAGTYTDTLHNGAANGCDSIVTLTLKVIEWCDTVRSEYTDSIFTGETYLFGCQKLTTAGTYKDVLHNGAANGCDSIVTLTLKVIEWCDTARYNYNAEIYEGQMFLFGCDSLKAEGIYKDTIIGGAANGCDSIITLALTFAEYDSVRHYASGEKYDTVCIGATYTTASGKDYTIQAEGLEIIDTVADYLPREKDVPNHRYIYFDTVTTYHVAAWARVDGAVVDSIYEGEKYLFGCRQLTIADTYNDTLWGGSIHGCDSIVTLTLSYKQPKPVECDTARYAFTDSIKEGEVYLFRCDTIKAEGTYSDTIVAGAANGCDSIIILTLKFKQPEPVPVECDTARYAFSDSIKEGQVYLFQCDTIKAEGTYSDTIVAGAANGCDSIITLTLKFKQPEPVPQPVECDTARYAFNDSIYEGEKYIFGCMQLSEEGTYADTLPNAAANGCDSIVTLTLTFKQPLVPYDSVRVYVNGEKYDSVCVGGTYMIGSTPFIVTADTTIHDTIPDYLPMQVDDEQHKHIYTDSVTAYFLTVWQLSDSTLQDSIELGKPYTFKGETFTPEEAGLVTDYDTLPNSHGCDSIVTLQLRVIKVDTLHEYVQGAVTDTLCAGTDYTYGSKTLTVTADTVVTDTVFAVQEVKVDSLHTLTYTDSVTTYTLLVWHNELTLSAEPEWGYAFCGAAYSDGSKVLEALREAIGADELFEKDTTVSLLYKDSTGTYVPYTGGEIAPETDEISLRAEVSNKCVTLQWDTTLSITLPDYEKSEIFDDMPATSKYNDWLLMVDLDSLNKVYHLYPEPDSVRWYRITGDKADVTVDELVGTGYYYTDDRHLVGKYYAIIGLPEVVDACGGSWRTRILVHTPANAPLRLAPSKAPAGEMLKLYNVKGDMPTTLRIYSAEGIEVNTWTQTADGTSAVLIPTNSLQSGVYLLYVNNAEQREALRFIIQQ